MPGILLCIVLQISPNKVLRGVETWADVCITRRRGLTLIIIGGADQLIYQSYRFSCTPVRNYKDPTLGCFMQWTKMRTRPVWNLGADDDLVRLKNRVVTHSRNALSFSARQESRPS